ncbi:MAG: hypothetical protein HZA19_03545 [Nitrospirae bacterium]|nr:hypothetical protein [Nitrospirota bacterium]
MNKIPHLRKAKEESFIAEELACDFCVEIASPTGESGEADLQIPPCHRCVGLIYALKSKAYFIIT